MEFNSEDRMDMEYEMVPMPISMPMSMGMPGMIMPQMMEMSGMMMPQMMGMMGRMYQPDMMEMDEMEEEDYGEEEGNESRGKESYRPNEVNRILRKIERYNPGIFRTMGMYGIPYPTARRLCRRIIRLTLMYYDD
ncbi:hypothetical protein [Clostridium ganghwense]|uniref:Uncharacterized protein n=1 Tax=Clostridium ganghwense TaxID=312089 RepID=A0ABT4CNY6_9CLOT|nr:hypothetical protein [Clostridium ganghwense]MCY6370757.1 hypothetical protein [Clostridium ganghwense]